MRRPGSNHQQMGIRLPFFFLCIQPESGYTSQGRDSCPSFISVGSSDIGSAQIIRSLSYAVFVYPSVAVQDWFERLKAFWRVCNNTVTAIYLDDECVYTIFRSATTYLKLACGLSFLVKLSAVKGRILSCLTNGRLAHQEYIHYCSHSLEKSQAGAANPAIQPFCKKPAERPRLQKAKEKQLMLFLPSNRW